MKKIIGLTFSILSISCADTISLKSGWNMVGAATDIELYRFENSCVDYIWKLNSLEDYGQIGWQAKVYNNLYSHSGEEIKLIKKFDGLWIKTNAACEVKINDDVSSTDTSTPVIDTLVYNITEGDLTVTNLSSTIPSTTYRLVGGDDHKFFFVDENGKIGLKEAFYTSTPSDINQDSTYNVEIETKAGDITHRNSLDFKIVPQSEFKIVSKFYNSVSQIYDTNLDQNGIYTPKVVGGKIDKVDGTVSYEQSSNSNSNMDMNSEPQPEPTCSEDWSKDSYCENMESVWPTCVDSSAIPTNAVNASCGTYDMDKMGYVTDETVQAQCALIDYGSNPPSYTYNSNMTAVCIPPTVETISSELVFDDSGKYPPFSIKLPIDTSNTYKVNINAYDGAKKATQTFEYTTNAGTPTAIDFTASVSANTWTQIDFASNISTNYYEYEIVKKPVNGLITKKADGTVWFYGSQSDSFEYKIRYHNGDETIANNQATTEIKTVTVEVQ
jgi:hypothetical protein